MSRVYSIRLTKRLMIQVCWPESRGDFAYAIDNVFNAPKRIIIWDCNDILPVRKHPFDNFSFLVPQKRKRSLMIAILDGLICLWTSAGMIILQRMFCLIPMFAPRWQSLSTNVISSYNGFD